MGVVVTIVPGFEPTTIKHKKLHTTVKMKRRKQAFCVIVASTTTIKASATTTASQPTVFEISVVVVILRLSQDRVKPGPGSEKTRGTSG